MTDRQRRHVREIMPLMLICVLMAFYSVNAAVNYSRLAESMPVLSNEQAMLDHEGELIPTSAPEPETMRIILPDCFDSAQSVCFYSSYQEVCVRLNGREIYSFLKPESEKILDAAPSYWNQVPIPPGSAGSTLEIELTTPYPQYAGVLPQVRCGTAEQVSRYVVMKTVPSFVAALAIFCIGIVFAIVAIIMRYYVVGNTGLYSLSLFIVMMALFLVSQQTTILLDLNGSVSYMTVQNLAFMLCPVLYSRYLTRVHNGVCLHFDRFIYALSILNFLLVVMLQIANVADMPQLMLFTRILCTVLVVYQFIQELRRKRRLLICIIALMLVYSTFLYYFTDSITWLVYAALFAYIYLVIYRVISTVVKVQAKEIRLEAQLEVSKSEIATIQITSHFFYHTLDSIRALIRLDADKAYKMTGDFAKYIRHRVDGVERMQETIPFSRELRSIRAYTDIKQAQLGDRFEMVYDVENEDFEILPLTVQPLVENAVIHAVQKRRGGGVVRLVCRETKAGYHIEVIDNGPGRDALPEASDAQNLSTSIRNVNTRLEFYGIAPLVLQKNDLGGMTVSLDTPKKIARKGDAE